MIDPFDLFNYLKHKGIEFFAGVPDSLLKSLCGCISQNTVIGKNHFITPNEGLAVSLATGYFLATGNIPMVYMQNSGIGNMVNPVTSLTNEEIFGIPILYFIGWRGKPGQIDEPQHKKQGQITQDLLETIGINSFLVTQNMSMNDLVDLFEHNYDSIISSNKSMALIIEKGTFSDYPFEKFKNDYQISREHAINTILKSLSERDIIVSTTGKISREVYDFREFNNQNHKQDFLTVGSMGHSSMIALGIAKHKPKHKVFCLDGDGAVIMHMGSLALIGSSSAENLVHIILNNSAYESVGGQPTIANHIDFCKVALSCGYKNAFIVDSLPDLQEILTNIKELNGPTIIDVHVSIGSRKDLSRPATPPNVNKQIFMSFLNSDQ